MRSANLGLIVGMALCASGCGLESAPIALERSRAGVDTFVEELVVDLQTSHPYAHRADQRWRVEGPADALRMRVVFERFETEYGYDFVELRDGHGALAHRLSGVRSGQAYLVEGPVVQVRFTSDGSVRAWGFSVSRVEIERPLPEGPGDHRPACRRVGQPEEGYYWADSGQLIALRACAALPEPECVNLGSRSEGWSVAGEFLLWDICHRTVRIALWGEACGPSIGFACHQGLFCQGLPQEGRGGTGACLDQGACLEEADCSNPDNPWEHARCMGRAACEDGACVWHCEPPEELRLGWVEVRVQGLESEHPYPNLTDQTWSRTWPGALELQLRFQRLELETGYDRLTVGGLDPAGQVGYDGRFEDVWSQVVEGDTAVLRLVSDDSVTGWGFRVDMARLHLPLPEGACSQDEHCPAGARCEPNDCIHPYAPCFGHCLVAGDGAEGEACDPGRGCAPGLLCKAQDELGRGSCQAETWCALETMEADCQQVAHIQVAGYWACPDSACRWMVGRPNGSFENAEPLAIPDADPAGVRSEIQVREMTSTCALETRVTVDIRHPYRGDLVVGLTSPSGERVVLHARQGGSADDLRLADLPVGLPGANGPWTLDVSDRAARDEGMLERWVLDFSCR
jgi:hypothetical protein